MTTDEQSQFDCLTAEHADLHQKFSALTAKATDLETQLAAEKAAHDALVAEHADLQARFNQMAPLILELQKELKTERDAHAVTRHSRDTFKTGFETQTAKHHDAIARVDRLRRGLPESEPAPVAQPETSAAPADGPTPAA